MNVCVMMPSFLIEPPSIDSPLLSMPKHPRSGKPSTLVLKHVVCIRVCMYLYYVCIMTWCLY